MRKVARMIVRDEKGCFLLIRTTKKGRNHWEFPGGKVDEGESCVAAAKRECLEETGITPIGDATLVSVQHLDSDVDNWEIYYFLASGYSGKAKIMEPEKSDCVGFLPIEQLAGLPQIPKLCIDLARGVWAKWPL